MKRALLLLLAMILTLSIAMPAFAVEPYKIAIITGTTSQGEEEYRAAEKLKELYPDIVVTDTYPDKFAAETETTIGKILAFANDPEVKAIIMCQAVQGATAAFTQIRNDLKRDDILLIAGVPAEDPQSITSVADIVMGVDEINGGSQIVDTAKEWGAEVLIHYSFARHMGYETIVARHNIMKEEAALAGIELVDRDAPDPTGDAGMVGAQNFILEDVPKVMQEYAGKKVAFFCTNCGMQEALQAAVLKEANAYYPLPCCPSPFHGFPASLGLGVESKDYGDIDSYIAKAAEVLKENDALGRFSTWAAPINMSIINGGFEYATKFINGEIEGRSDGVALKEALMHVTGSDLAVSNYEDGDGKVYEKYFMLLFDNIDFADYLD
ncbi:MAG: DUF3798 domain-containing protein [Clostridiales bacterium]|nr:DUF3798 domain-containing protein [Clostridiales bacterium]